MTPGHEAWGLARGFNDRVILIPKRVVQPGQECEDGKALVAAFRFGLVLLVQDYLENSNFRVVQFEGYHAADYLAVQRRALRLFGASQKYMHHRVCFCGVQFLNGGAGHRSRRQPGRCHQEGALRT